MVMNPSKQMKQSAFTLAAAALLIFSSAPARGDDSDAVVSSTATPQSLPTLPSNRLGFAASYSVWFLLPTIRDMDGLEGPGSKLQVQNYIQPSYNLGDDWRIRSQVRWDYNLGSKNSFDVFVNGEKETRYLLGTELRDPYLGIQKADILPLSRWGNWHAFRLNYYLPTSRITRMRVGSDMDRGNGTVQGEFISEQPLGDSPWSLFFSWSLYHYISQATKTAYNDYYIENFSQIKYSFNDDRVLYLSYNNYVDHFRDKGWDPWHQKHFIELGMINKVIKDLYLITSLEASLKGNDGSLLAILDYKLF